MTDVNFSRFDSLADIPFLGLERDPRGRINWPLAISQIERILDAGFVVSWGLLEPLFGVSRTHLHAGVKRHAPDLAVAVANCATRGAKCIEGRRPSVVDEFSATKGGLTYLQLRLKAKHINKTYGEVITEPLPYVYKEKRAALGRSDCFTCGAARPERHTLEVAAFSLVPACPGKCQDLCAQWVARGKFTHAELQEVYSAGFSAPDFGYAPRRPRVRS